MTTIPGCYAIGEANFSDHGANRLGASALMQGLGRWILCVALHHWGLSYRADIRTGPISTDSPRVRSRREKMFVKDRIGRRLSSNEGTHSVDYYHREAGQHHVGQVWYGEKLKKD